MRARPLLLSLARRRTMATKSNAPDDKRWLAVPRVVDNLIGQSQPLADAGDRESERVTGLEKTARLILELQLRQHVEAAGRRARGHSGGAELRVAMRIGQRARDEDESA